MIARWTMRLLATTTLSLLGCVSELDLGHHADGGGGSSVDAGDGGALDAGHEGKLIFVTDNRYIGDLRTEGGAASGLAGGDAICMMEAKAAHLGGVYRAWLSSSTENAKDRIAPVGPWRRVDGITVFPGHAVVGPPLHYLQISASGDTLFASTNPEVWTGTTGDGVYDPDHTACGDWASGASSQEGTYGIVVSDNDEWTEYGLFGETLPCSARARLYCFEQ
ncbi:Hypothetical protein A7982_05727 [Minicystis rosea]|nr:Hypothetical protein A7982_05727 [Minicystis rosea]